MTWHDVTWRDMTWRDVTWRDVTWRDVTWRHVTSRHVMWCDVMWCDVMWYMICMICYIFSWQLGSQPVAVVRYTFTRRHTYKQYTERHKTNNTQNNTKNWNRVQAVPCLCELCPGICLTTEEKARKNLSQDSRRVPVGTMNKYKHTITIHRHNNKNT